MIETVSVTMGYLDKMIEDSKEKEEEEEEEKKKQEEEKKEKQKEDIKKERPTKEEEPKKESYEKIEEKKEEYEEPESEEKPEEEGPTEVEVEGEKELITSYGDVEIYKVKDEPLPFYKIPVIKPTGPEKKIVNTIKEAATRLITVPPEKFRSAERRRKFYFKRIKEIIESNPELGVPKTKVDFYADMVVRGMIGYGVIDPLVRDKKLEEIMVLNPEDPVHAFHRDYGMMKTNVKFGREDDIRDIIDRIGRQVGRRVDRSKPLLDARLPDGSRVNATIEPISLDGSTLTIRKFREKPITITDLIKWNTVSAEAGAFLWLMAEGLGVRPANTLVSGGTASGKTTTLNVMSSFVPARERVITVEQTAELQLPMEHIIRLETRPPGLEGKGNIDMSALVKNSLRMRPDRIIVGEIRGDEAFSLFTAMNTGHDGSMGTVHANSARETITRVTSPPMNVPIVMANALDFIIIQQRIHSREKGLIRRVTKIAEVENIKEDGSPVLNPLYTYDPTTDSLKRKKTPSHYKKELLKYTNLSKEDLEDELDEREELLEKLVKKGVSDLKTIKDKVKEFEMKKYE